jgi:CheY-like chemotaxis protein
MTLAESASTRSLRPVLLVDWCPRARAAIAAAARDAGFLPRTAASPHRALCRLAREDERCDALVVPMGLGEREARELIDQARRLRRQLPLLLLLRSGSEGATEECLLSGSDDARVRAAPASPASAVVCALEELLAGPAGASEPPGIRSPGLPARVGVGG